MFAFATIPAVASGLSGFWILIPACLLLLIGAIIAVRIVRVRSGAGKNTDDRPTVPPSAPVELTEAEKLAQDWWQNNPNKRRLTVSGPCSLTVSRGSEIVGRKADQAEVTDSAEVILCNGKLTAKFRSAGKVTWLEFRASDGKHLETSVDCSVGCEIEITAEGKVSVSDVHGEQADIKAVNCAEVSVHREKARLVCSGVGKVYADCSTASAADCRDASFSGYTRAVAVNCKQVAAHDNAVVYADSCKKVIIMGSSRVKTVRCPDVLHSDRETSVWEKA